MEQVFLKAMTPKEVLQMAKVWKHEIEKLNMGVCRGYISMFTDELPKSVTVGELAREINSFYLMPTPFGKEKMKELAGKLVSELEAEIETQPTAAVQGA